MKILRVIFTILCAVCIAALPVAGIFGGLPFAGIALLGAGVFFTLMLACKSRQLAEEQKQSEPQQPAGDFFHPVSPTEEIKNNQENKQ